MNKEKVMKLEYELFLDGYTTKQIAELVGSSYLKVKMNLNKVLRKIDKEKTLIKGKSLQISFN